MPVINPQGLLNNLFNNLQSPVRQMGWYVRKGAVITFSYMGQTKNPINDPYPMVLVSDIFKDMIRGVNLHYMNTFYIQRVITDPNMAGNRSFSFANISGDNYIINAFRSYKRIGISNIRMLDLQYLKGLLTISKALKPGELELVRSQVKDIMDQQMRQPTAEPGLPQT